MKLILSTVFFFFFKRKKNTAIYDDAIHQGFKDLGKEMGYRPKSVTWKK